MPFTKPLPEWDAVGVEPPASTKQNGYQAGDKPPADWFNWFFHLVYQALQELQQNGYTQAEITQAIAGVIATVVPNTDVTTTAAANKLLKLDANSKLPASITGNADGNAATASKLQTARTIGLGGDATGSASFDGSGNVTITAALVAANILSKLLTVDGSGSGLDGDTVDGKHYSDITTAISNAIAALTKASVGLSNVDNTSDANKPLSIAQSAAISTAISALKAITQNIKITADDGSYQQLFVNDADFVSAFKTMSKGLHYVGESDIGQHILCLANGGYGYAFSINAGGSLGNQGDLYVRTLINGTVSPWMKINDAPADVLSKLLMVDGSGSGLDADLLDGHDSSYFLPSANVVDSGWKTVTLANGVTGYGQTRKITFGSVSIVAIDMHISNVNTSGTVCYLPSGFAPSAGLQHVTDASNAMGIINRFMAFSLGTDGNMSTWGINQGFNPDDNYEFQMTYMK